MSKEFKRQDWHKKKKLGTSWRKPKGYQSKIRKSMGGKPKLVRIGRKQKSENKIIRINSYLQFQKEVQKIKKEGLVVLISGRLGLLPKIKILKEAINLNLKIDNMRKPDLVLSRLQKKVEERKKKKAERKKKIEKKEKKNKEEKKETTEKKEKQKLTETEEEMSKEEKAEEEKKEKDRMLISTN